jgi:hypothetical protein
MEMAKDATTIKDAAQVRRELCELIADLCHERDVLPRQRLGQPQDEQGFRRDQINTAIDHLQEAVNALSWLAQPQSDTFGS